MAIENWMDKQVVPRNSVFFLKSQALPQKICTLLGKSRVYLQGFGLDFLNQIELALSHPRSSAVKHFVVNEA